MRERPLAFGPERGLVGVLTEAEAPREGVPVFVFPNVGVHSHIGPYRGYVDLARRLAGLGFSTLRFDLAGLGDSNARTEPAEERARARADLGDALATLEGRGARCFAVLGFCSGAEPTQSLLRDDPRVVGGIFIDGYAYRTPRWFLHRLPRYAHRETWKAALRRRRERWAGRTESAVYALETPTRERCEADLLQAQSRGARLLLMFTGGAQLWFNHAGQAAEMFPRLFAGAGVEEAYDSEADHLFSTLGDRQRLFTLIERWADRNFPR